MFNSSEKLLGFKVLLERIKQNEETAKLTHKQIRSYARCLLTIFDSLYVDYTVKSEMLLLLEMLASGGIPHYDRSFLANQILELLEESIRIDKQELNNESF